MRIEGDLKGKTSTGVHTVEPATRWEDALPLGNGSLGALVFGGICSERIVVNHETLWADTTHESPPDISDALPALRTLLDDGKWKEATDFLAEQFRDKGYAPPRTDPYHPAFDIRLMSRPHQLFSNYARELDFESGQVSLRWQEGTHTFSRNCFVSCTDDLIAIRYTCSEPIISAVVNLQPRDLAEENGSFAQTGRNLTEETLPIRYEESVLGASSISLTARYTCKEAEFGGYARIILPGGGTISHQEGAFSNQHRDTLENGLLVTDASEIVLLVKVYGERMPETSLEEIAGQLDAVTDSYDDLFARHAAEHRKVFSRVSVDLGARDVDLANEHLLLNSFSGNVSTALIEKMFNYGRYLLMTSSRPNGWPANLQGLWNGDYQPAWSSDYHNDENIQMNYWPALPGNLPSSLEPYFDFFEACIPDMQRNARCIYGCRGIMAPLAQDIKGRAMPPHGWGLNWVSGAGWLAQPFFDYWLCTRDDDFLENRALPFLEQVALFYEDFLFERDGRLVFSPSMSPENRPRRSDGSQIGAFATINATMDVAVAREVLTNLCMGCTHLGIKKDEVERWQKMIDMLPSYEINEDGAMAEWLHPYLHDNYNHRHLSHIYPLFPGFEITKENRPEQFEACRVAVEKRRTTGQSAQSGWSLAHLANIYARLGDGEKALTCLETLLRSCVGPNLFTYHNDWRHMGLSVFWNFKDRLFQIDANFGLSAAVLEMLIYSNPTTIGILPALPAAWGRGSVKGILTRCGVEVDVSWDMTDGRIDLALRAKQACRIALRFQSPVVVVNSDVEARDTDLGDHCREVILEAGQEYQVQVVKRDNGSDTGTI